MEVAKKAVLWALIALPFASLVFTAFGDVPLIVVLLAMFVLEPLMIALILRLQTVFGVKIIPDAEDRSDTSEDSQGLA